MTEMEAIHKDMVSRLCKKGEEIIDEMTPQQAHLLHMAIGVAGEAGELLDAFKKYVIYNKELDFLNVVEELGDLEFYMEGIRQELSITRESVLATNHDKLGKRYKSYVYTDEQAVNRADKS